MLTAWTTYDELTEDQRRRFGAYVAARDAARNTAAAAHEQGERARRNLTLSGGDTLAALALSLEHTR